MRHAAILDTISVLFVSAPVVRDLLCGKIEHLLYKIDEDRLIQMVGLEIGCHYSIEKILDKDKVHYRFLDRLAFGDFSSMHF